MREPEIKVESRGERVERRLQSIEKLILLMREAQDARAAEAQREERPPPRAKGGLPLSPAQMGSEPR